MGKFTASHPTLWLASRTLIANDANGSESYDVPGRSGFTRAGVVAFESFVLFAVFVMHRTVRWLGFTAEARRARMRRLYAQE